MARDTSGLPCTMRKILNVARYDYVFSHALSENILREWYSNLETIALEFEIYNQR